MTLYTIADLGYPIWPTGSHSKSIALAAGWLMLWAGSTQETFGYAKKYEKMFVFAGGCPDFPMVDTKNLIVGEHWAGVTVQLDNEMDVMLFVEGTPPPPLTEDFESTSCAEFFDLFITEPNKQFPRIPNKLCLASPWDPDYKL